MTPQRVSLITLGVADIDRSRKFYNDLGWTPVASPPEVVFFQMDGLVLGLFGLGPLAADQGRPDAKLGVGAMSLAQNFPSTELVDVAFDKAISAGATVLKAPEQVFWGGYSGYYSDPDGHVWEVAHNPFWTIDGDGRITIPVDG
ncbi:MAG: VOC family protein [Silicimonas sp.]|mgnify:FL=1|nr:VOC family protein [Silicimonas sp.]